MLRLALRLNSSLRIDLQRAPAVRVTHEFLHYFHVLSVCHQHGRKAVAERVPADVLPNPGAEGCWADHTRKKDVRPVRVPAPTVRTGKYPVLRLAVHAVLLPTPQLCSQS